MRVEFNQKFLKIKYFCNSWMFDQIIWFKIMNSLSEEEGNQLGGKGVLAFDSSYFCNNNVKKSSMFMYVH